MIVMFTSAAYSAVRSNNLQSGYPEGCDRLKMSNIFPALHVCRDVVLITVEFLHNVDERVCAPTLDLQVV